MTELLLHKTPKTWRTTGWDDVGYKIFSLFMKQNIAQRRMGSRNIQLYAF
jgi:hypothetical protein